MPFRGPDCGGRAFGAIRGPYCAPRGLAEVLRQLGALEDVVAPVRGAGTLGLLQRLVVVLQRNKCYRDSVVKRINAKLMAQLIVRELEDVVKQGLKRRAVRHGRSMEEEIREILRNAAREEQGSPTRLGSRIAARFRNTGLDTDLPELRGTEASAADFAE